MGLHITGMTTSSPLQLVPADTLIGEEPVASGALLIGECEYDPDDTEWSEGGSVRGYSDVVVIEGDHDDLAGFVGDIIATLPAGTVTVAALVEALGRQKPNSDLTDQPASGRVVYAAAAAVLRAECENGMHRGSLEPGCPTCLRDLVDEADGASASVSLESLRDLVLPPAPATPKESAA